MKLLFTADIHVDSRHLSALCDTAAGQSVDGLIIGGDLIPHFLPRPSPENLLKAQADYLETVLVPRLKAFRESTKCSIYLDLGNDDLMRVKTPQIAFEYAAVQENVSILHVLSLHPWK